MNIKLPILIVTYNRPDSLQRLLNSIVEAYYPSQIDVDLIISIDFSGKNDCFHIANDFNWIKGKKKIIKHNENLGLRNHIISCGNISLDYDGVIILEDDCFVAKDFYNYAVQAYHFYHNDPKIAGISLYSYQFNDNVKMPFETLKDGNDVYFMQIPSSSGQLWTKNQWKLFVEFYKFNPITSEQDKIPEYVKKWPESSWKKYFYKYMVEKDLYFVYPQISLSTNFGDIGKHSTTICYLHQVSINSGVNLIYKFITIIESCNIYDAYFEIQPECLNKLGFDFEFPFSVDTYLSKQYNVINAEYILTTYSNLNTVKQFGISLKPLINNIIYNIKGEGLYIVPATEYNNKHKQNNLDSIFKNQNAVPYQIGYENGYNKGEENIRNTRTFNLGRTIITIFDFRNWLKPKSKNS